MLFRSDREQRVVDHVAVRRGDRRRRPHRVEDLEVDLGRDLDGRARALREGEQMLETNSLSHNYLRFYRFAIETSLESRDWDNAERYAAALEEFTREEPLPWADLIIERGRALAAHGRGDRSMATHETLARLLEQARACRLVTIAHALDAALSEPGWSRPGA